MVCVLAMKNGDSLGLPQAGAFRIAKLVQINLVSMVFVGEISKFHGILIQLYLARHQPCRNEETFTETNPVIHGASGVYHPEIMGQKCQTPAWLKTDVKMSGLTRCGRVKHGCSC